MTMTTPARLLAILAAAFLWSAVAHADLDHIKRSAEAGDAEAQLELGILFEYGFRLKDNEIPALTWYSISANQGNAKAAKLRDALMSKMNPKEVEEAMEQVKSFKAKPLPAGAAPFPAAPTPETKPESAAAVPPAPTTAPETTPAPEPAEATPPPPAAPAEPAPPAPASNASRSHPSPGCSDPANFMAMASFASTTPQHRSGHFQFVLKAGLIKLRPEVSGNDP
jgi:hypothetical protein